MSRVWLRMAGTSEATKYSLSPKPITTGGPMRAATILPGSRPADDGRWRRRPRSSRTALRTASSRLPCEVLLDQVRDDFRIGFGQEAVALLGAAAA